MPSCRVAWASYEPLCLSLPVHKGVPSMRPASVVFPEGSSDLPCEQVLSKLLGGLHT